MEPAPYDKGGEKRPQPLAWLKQQVGKAAIAISIGYSLWLIHLDAEDPLPDDQPPTDVLGNDVGTYDFSPFTVEDEDLTTYYDHYNNLHPDS